MRKKELLAMGLIMVSLTLVTVGIEAGERKQDLRADVTPGLKGEEGREKEVPVYICVKVDRELKITGKLDDSLWKNAQVVRLGRADGSGEGRFPTEVRLLCSDTTLYIGFHCVDDYAWGTLTKRDSSIFFEECVEVFISPAKTWHHYYEINVSPRNVVFDSCILNGRLTPGALPYVGLNEWDTVGMKTSVHVEGKLDTPGGARYWNVEYAISLKTLIGAPHIPPRAGDEWYMNLYRIDTPQGKKTELYAWSPVDDDFHTPRNFGLLRFK